MFDCSGLLVRCSVLRRSLVRSSLVRSSLVGRCRARISFICPAFLRRSFVRPSLIRPSFVRGSGPAALALFAVFAILSPAINSWAQGEAAENTNPMTGTIQGTLLDEDGNAVVGAKVLYISPDTETRGFTRSVKGGKYVSESLPPGPYVVRVEGRDFLPVESRVTVVVASAVKADFKLEYISPGPARLESQFSGDLSGTLPINGRNYLSPG